MRELDPAISAGVELDADADSLSAPMVYEVGYRDPEAPPGEYEEMVVPAEEARVQGRVVYVLHPPGRKGGA